MANTKLISEWFVRPNPDVVKRSKKQPPYFHLTPLDICMLSINNIQEGILFPKPRSSSSASTSTINSSFLEKLKLSLSLALVYFYPLAGRLVTKRYEDDHSCSIHVDCDKGPGARLIHAAAPDITVMDVIAPNADVPLFIQSFFDFGQRSINDDGHTKPLLSVQVTDLADGVFVGFSINHSVVDGTSFLHFLHVWSNIFMRSSGVEQDHMVQIDQLMSMQLVVPVIERPLIYDEYGPTIKLPYLDPQELRNDYERPIRERVFHFSAAAMSLLKAKANAECCNTTTISSFQALTALVWRSITRARNLSSEEETTCKLPVNMKPQLEPHSSNNSNNYFGNYVTVATGAAKVGELLTSSLGWVAMLLHHAIATVLNKTAHEILVRPFLEGCRHTSLMSQFLAFQGPNRVAISGSPRLDFYGVEYGLGRPVACRNGYANRGDGVIFVTTGREGGSVEITIRLRPHRMNALLLDEEFLSFVNFSPKL